VTQCISDAIRGAAEVQFATLIPPDGDAYLRVQDIDDGAAGSHLDLHVDDIHASAAEATSGGAQVVGDFGDVIVLRSPAGLVFCVVEHEREHLRPRARSSPKAPAACSIRSASTSPTRSSTPSWRSGPT
jgi:hypothetical protein